MVESLQMLVIDDMEGRLFGKVLLRPLSTRSWILPEPKSKASETLDPGEVQVQCCQIPLQTCQHPNPNKQRGPAFVKSNERGAPVGPKPGGSLGEDHGTLAETLFI